MDYSQVNRPMKVEERQEKKGRARDEYKNAMLDDKMIEMLDEMENQGFLYENDNNLVKIANSADEVFNFL